MMHYVSALGVRCTEIVVISWIETTQFWATASGAAARGLRAAFSRWMAGARGHAGHTIEFESCMRPPHAELHHIISRWSRGSSAGDGDGVIDTYIHNLTYISSYIYIYLAYTYSGQSHQPCPRKMGWATCGFFRFRLVGPWNLRQLGGVRAVRACGRESQADSWLDRGQTCSTCSNLEHLRTRLFICTVCLVVGPIMSYPCPNADLQDPQNVAGSRMTRPMPPPVPPRQVGQRATWM